MQQMRCNCTAKVTRKSHSIYFYFNVITFKLYKASFSIILPSLDSFLHNRKVPLTLYVNLHQNMRSWAEIHKGFQHFDCINSENDWHISRLHLDVKNKWKTILIYSVNFSDSSMGKYDSYDWYPPAETENIFQRQHRNGIILAENGHFVTVEIVVQIPARV